MFHAFDVSFARGRRQVIADMSLELRTDELTVVIGPNGAGKSRCWVSAIRRLYIFGTKAHVVR